MTLRRSGLVVIATVAAASAARAGDFDDDDFSLRLPAALSRFSRYPDVAGTAGASAGAAWGSSANPAATAWLTLEGLSPQFSRVDFHNGTKVQVASASWSTVVEGLGSLQPSVARAWSNRAKTRDGLDFEYGTTLEEIQWARKPREDTALGLNLFAAQSALEFGSGGVTLIESRSSVWGVRAGVLRQVSEPLRAGASLEYSASFDRSRDPSTDARSDGTTRQVVLRPGLAWEYGHGSRAYLDYEGALFANASGSLRADRFLAGVDHEVVLFLNARAGTVVDTKGNASLALGLGVFPSERVFIDLAWQRDMFPEVRREFGRSRTLALSVSFVF